MRRNKNAGLQLCIDERAPPDGDAETGRCCGKGELNFVKLQSHVRLGPMKPGCPEPARPVFGNGPDVEQGSARKIDPAVTIGMRVQISRRTDRHEPLGQELFWRKPRSRTPGHANSNVDLVSRRDIFVSGI